MAIAAEVKNGQRLTVIVEGQTTDTWINPSGFDEADLRAGVMDILSNQFTVNSLSIMPRASVLIGYLGWPYRAELVIVTRTAYASHNDPASIVGNAFYQVGGSMPTVTVEGFGAPQRPGVDSSQEPPSDWFGLGVFGVVAIAVAVAAGVFVLKRG